MSLIKKPVFWIAVIGVGVAGFVLTESDAPKGKVVNHSAKKKTTTKKQVVQFTEEDKKASFKPLNTELKNAFLPIVARKSGGFGNGDGAANSIPLDFTGGDSGWIYTGNAEIDGVATALIENRMTGEGVYLKAGERWKSCAVSRIMSDAIVMMGPSGTKTFTLTNEQPRMARNGFNPAPINVPPTLRGELGNNNRGRNGGPRGGQAMQVLPDASGGVFTVPSGGGADIVFSPME